MGAELELLTVTPSLLLKLAALQEMCEPMLLVPRKEPMTYELIVKVENVSAPKNPYRWFAGWGHMGENIPRSYGIYALPDDADLPEVGQEVKVTMEWRTL